MQEVIYKKVDEATRGRINTVMAASEAAGRQDPRLQHILEDIKELDDDIVYAMAGYFKLRYYIDRDVLFWTQHMLPTFVRDTLKNIATSRNICSKKIKDTLENKVFVIQNLPFKLCFKTVPEREGKKTGLRSYPIFITEYKTLRGTLITIGNMYAKQNYIITQHCFERICERLGLNYYQLDSVKEMFAISLFNDPILVNDQNSRDAYLLFNGFMCLGQKLGEHLHFFKTAITKDMYNKDQQSLAEITFLKM
jgi:hypothetical protein